MFFNGSLGPQYIGRCCPLSKGSLSSVMIQEKTSVDCGLPTKNIMWWRLSIFKGKSCFSFTKQPQSISCHFSIYFSSCSFICVCERCGNWKQFNLWWVNLIGFDFKMLSLCIWCLQFECVITRPKTLLTEAKFPLYVSLYCICAPFAARL